MNWINIKAHCTKPHLFLSILVGVSVLYLVSSAYSDGTPNIEVKIAPVKEKYSLEGPIGLIWTITNKSQNNLFCDFVYPEGISLQFVPLNGLGNMKEKDRSLGLEGAYRMILLKPGNTYKATIFLNRYLSIFKPGYFQFDYVLNMRIYKEDKGKIVASSLESMTFKGVLNINVEKVSDEILNEELNNIAKDLVSIDSERYFEENVKQKKMESIESLVNLSTPLVIKYLEEMLLITDAEIPAIEALGRFRTTQALKLIENVLPRKNPFIIKSALQALGDQKVLLSHEKVKSILSVIDPWDDQSKYVVIQYLSRVGNYDYIPLIEAFLKEENSDLVNAANEAINKLRKGA